MQHLQIELYPTASMSMRESQIKSRGAILRLAFNGGPGQYSKLKRSDSCSRLMLVNCLGFGGGCRRCQNSRGVIFFAGDRRRATGLERRSASSLARRTSVCARRAVVYICSSGPGSLHPPPHLLLIGTCTWSPPSVLI